MRVSFAYCSPEIYFGEPYQDKADVYSFAIIFWALVTRCIKREYVIPYANLSLKFDFQIILQTAKRAVRPIIPNCPQSISSLITSSWDHDKNKRPSCAYIISQLESIEEEYRSNMDAWNLFIGTSTKVSIDD